jgi:cobalamin biosynthesis Co2+ chelatase CbiK
MFFFFQTTKHLLLAQKHAYIPLLMFFFKNMDVTCDNVESFLRCVLKAEGSGKKSTATELDLRRLKARVNVILKQNNVHCYPNLDRMIKELEEEETEDVHKGLHQVIFTGGYGLCLLKLLSVLET